MPDYYISFQEKANYRSKIRNRTGRETTLHLEVDVMVHRYKAKPCMTRS
ncbi:MAG: hypothetical protein V2I32_02685 [Desulforhopalus sp.]|jgi:hypothetical protein|nr:hypothetical protein [Desulforhopalus sp.]